MYVGDCGANLTYPWAQVLLLSWDSGANSRSVCPRISEARESKQWREGGASGLNFKGEKQEGKEGVA